MKRLTITLLILLSLAALNLALGSVMLPLKQVWGALVGDDSTPVIAQNIVLKSRFPQTITAMLAGAGLAVSGLIMQTIFRNPLAGPTVLGISNGASLGVAFIVLLNGAVGGQALATIGVRGEMATIVAGILGAIAIMLIIIQVSAKVKSTVTLLVFGVMVGYMANALIGVLKFFSIEEDVRTFVVWGLGSFGRISPDRLMPFIYMMLIALALSVPLAKRLNMMLLGDMYARNLGLNVRRTRTLAVVCSSVLCAIVTSYCGPIAFLGLAVPHLCRGLFGSSDHRILIPACMVVGAALSLLCNIIARLPGFEGVLPINSVAALIGAPIVCWVLFKKKNS